MTRVDSFDIAARAIMFISAHTRLSLETLESRCRKRQVVFARWLIIRLVRKHTGLKQTQIALLLNHDHGVVYHGVKALRNAESYPKIKAYVEEVERYFSAISGSIPKS